MIMIAGNYKKTFSLLYILIKRSVEFDPTSNYLCSSSFDNTLKVYDIA